jgi:hypothetical protein
MEIFIYIKINYSSKLKLCTTERSFPASDANRAGPHYVIMKIRLYCDKPI